MKKMWETHGPQETLEIGKTIRVRSKARGRSILPGWRSGSGKNRIYPGLCQPVLALQEPVSSPTFTIVQQYEEGRLPLYHFDVYRIGDVEEMDEIGYED